MLILLSGRIIERLHELYISFELYIFSLRSYEDCEMHLALKVKDFIHFGLDCPC
jgi:hypothetical protein